MKPCAQCGGEFVPRDRRHRFCSPQCKAASRAAALRAAYVPRPVIRVERSCSEPDCNRKHLALSKCRSHYYKSKGYDRRVHHLLAIGALVGSVGGNVVCERGPFGGLWVWCPKCGAMAGVPNGDRQDKRYCAPCDLSFLVNAEELEVLCAAAQ